MQKALDIYEKRFCSAVKDWFEEVYKPSHGKGAVSQCARFLGVSQGHFSMILKGEKCWRSEEERRQVASKIGRPYEEMTGDPADTPPEPTCPEEHKIIELQHIDIVRQFSDKPRAKNVNLDLLDLERLAPNVYQEATAYIRGLANGIRHAAEQKPYYGPERRKKDRRGGESDPPDSGDRRGFQQRRQQSRDGGPQRYIRKVLK